MPAPTSFASGFATSGREGVQSAGACVAGVGSDDTDEFVQRREQRIEGRVLVLSWRSTPIVRAMWELNMREEVRRVWLGTFSYSWLTFLLPRRCIMVNFEPASKLDAVGECPVLRCVRVRSGVGVYARSGWAGDLAASCACRDRDFRRDAS